MNFIKQLGVPFASFIIFFIFQSKGAVSEKTLTVFIVGITILTFIISYNRNEWLLFIAGLAMGIIIEIGLRYFGYQQVWERASFFGVPYWLPLIWGFGFVIITRLGSSIRGI